MTRRGMLVPGVIGLDDYNAPVATTPPGHRGGPRSKRHVGARRVGCQKWRPYSRGYWKHRGRGDRYESRCKTCQKRTNVHPHRVQQLVSPPAGGQRGRRKQVARDLYHMEDEAAAERHAAMAWRFPEGWRTNQPGEPANVVVRNDVAEGEAEVVVDGVTYSDPDLVPSSYRGHLEAEDGRRAEASASRLEGCPEHAPEGAMMSDWSCSWQTCPQPALWKAKARRFCYYHAKRVEGLIDDGVAEHQLLRQVRHARVRVLHPRELAG
jgi:hypothetical protein